MTVATLPDDYHGDRVVLQAKLHPNYLAATHHPRVLRADADLVMVGTRASRGTLRRRSGPDKENTPTKTLLLAATTASLDESVSCLPIRQRQSRSRRSSSVSRASCFREQSVCHAEGQPTREDPDAELVWEAVLHPAIESEDFPQLLLPDRGRQAGALVEQLDGNYAPVSDGMSAR